MKKLLPLAVLVACGSSSDEAPSLSGTYAYTTTIKSSTCSVPLAEAESGTWQVTETGNQCVFTFKDGTQGTFACVNGAVAATVNHVVTTPQCDLNLTDTVALVAVGNTVTGTQTLNASGPCQPACTVVVSLTATRM